MESRNPTMPKSQRSISLKRQTKKATQNTNCHGEKSQLIHRQKSHIKIFLKQKTEKTPKP